MTEILSLPELYRQVNVNYVTKFGLNVASQFEQSGNQNLLIPNDKYDDKPLQKNKKIDKPMKTEVDKKLISKYVPVPVPVPVPVSVPVPIPIHEPVPNHITNKPYQNVSNEIFDKQNFHFLRQSKQLINVYIKFEDSNVYFMQKKDESYPNMVIRYDKHSQNFYTLTKTAQSLELPNYINMDKYVPIIENNGDLTKMKVSELWTMAKLMNISTKAELGGRKLKADVVNEIFSVFMTNMKFMK
jgi:hypothetical protein